MTIEYVIDTKDLAAGYGDQLVLDGVDLQIHAGAITCIIGGSGSGKSTVLKAFVGLIPILRGTVKVFGVELETLPEEDRATLLSRVGLMFQEGGLLNSLTVAENLAVPLRAHTQLPPEVESELVRMKLGLVRLDDALEKLPGELSGGMKKRAGLARALMLDPELVLCDEPSAGLDPATQAEVDQLIVSLRDTLGLTVVVVTHEVESIKAIADRVVLLEAGKVTFDGTLAEALASDNETLNGFFERRAKPRSPPKEAATAPSAGRGAAHPEDDPPADESMFGTMAVAR